MFINYLYSNETWITKWKNKARHKYKGTKRYFWDLLEARNTVAQRLSKACDRNNKIKEREEQMLVVHIWNISMKTEKNWEWKLRITL